MKNSEVFWEAACLVSNDSGVCWPSFAVLSVFGVDVPPSFSIMAQAIRDAGIEYVNQLPMSQREVSFDFLHLMSLKAEDDEALQESIRLAEARMVSPKRFNAPMIPINKLSDVYLGDNVKPRCTCLGMVGADDCKVHS